VTVSHAASMPGLPRAPVPFAVASAAAIALIALAHAAVDGRPDSALRHAYVIPVAAMALRFGATSGAVTALAVLLLEAPPLFVATERDGISASVLDAGLSYLVLLALGPALGALASESQRQRRRYETLLAAQRALADEQELDVALRRLRAALEPRLDAAVAIVARDDERLVVTGGETLESASPAAFALHGGVEVFVADAAPGSRPRRSLSVPLLARGASVGALVVERAGELSAGDRRAVAELGVYLGLALENSRLASRQRRFTDDLARKVEEATERLAEMDRTKSALLALASHELRTPLTPLLGFSELLATRAFAPEEVRRLADIMRRETERLARIVDDFLDLSRLERGLPLRLQPVAVSVGPAVLGAVELFHRGRGSHRVVCECVEPLPRIRADPDALDRILKNLISNAIKYSPSGSEVRVRAARRDAVVELTVEDDGRGMAPETLGRIFEPYFRAPDAVNAARGTGLGLAVVKSLVDAHGGSIEVDSTPGVGTRFAVKLPVVP